jgi:hypothetical protein
MTSLTKKDSTLSGLAGVSNPGPDADSRELDTEEENINVALEDVGNKNVVSFNITDDDDNYSKVQEEITTTTQEKGEEAGANSDVVV